MLCCRLLLDPRLVMSDTSGKPRDPGGDERLLWQQPLLHAWWGGGGRKDARSEQRAGNEGGAVGE